MEHSIEHKVSHKEWDEVTLSANVFLANHQKFQDSDDFLSCFYPTFEFENGSVFADEMWTIKDGKIKTSSYESGVMRWDDKRKTYVRHVHFHETELGDLVSVSFTLNDDLKKILND